MHFMEFILWAVCVLYSLRSPSLWTWKDGSPLLVLGFHPDYNVLVLIAKAGNVRQDKSNVRKKLYLSILGISN